MRLSYLKTIFYSFYSAYAYINAHKNWNGFGLKYLFIVTILSSSLVSFGWLWHLGKISPEKVADSVTAFILAKPDLTFEENLNRFINLLQQIPEITIENGKAVISGPQPYIIKDPVSGYDMAILDTSGQYKSIQDTDAVLLLTDTKLIIKNESGSENVHYLHDIIRKSSIEEANFNEILYIIAQIPSFGLHSGKFTTESNELATILDKENRKLMEIGPGASLTDEAQPMIVITPDEINYRTIFNKNVGTIKATELNEQMFYDLIVSAMQMLKKIILWSVPLFVLPFIVLTSFAFNCAMLLFYAFIGHNYIKIMKLGQYEYKEIMRIAAVAITPTLVAGAVIPQVIPSQGTIYFLISIGYLYYAVRSITTR